MLQSALEAEVDSFVSRHRATRDEDGRRHVVRNGYCPERDVLTGAGPLKVKQPRVRDRRGAGADDRVSFTSSILPPYLRRSKKLDELVPWLYLRGISTGDMQPALEALLGENAGTLSANTVVRLKEQWAKEHDEWRKQSLAEREFVYVWADGVYFNIRLEDDRQCILVLMGATKDGKKRLLGILDGFRESEQSWSELLIGLKQRGLRIAPKVAVGDGALGFWKALRKVFPATREQRCWVHKTANVLNALPRSVQFKAKKDLHEIWQAETRDDAYRAFDTFIEKYDAKFPKATAKLTRDRDALLTFYDFPAEHWSHLRTTNPIESTFATVRLRHRRTKGSGTRHACLAMVFRLIQLAETNWRRLKSSNLLLKVVDGVRFVDGLEERNAA